MNKKMFVCFLVLVLFCLNIKNCHAENIQNDWFVEEKAEWNHDPNEQQSSFTGPPLFVSLGWDCLPAVCMRLEHLRQAAFPFDWNHSVFIEKIVQIIDEDFEYFFSPHLFQEGVNFHEDTNSYSKINTRYMLEFVHDQNINDVMQAKYQRRIARFRSLKDYQGKIVFVRIEHDSRRFPFNNRARKIFGNEIEMRSLMAESVRNLRDTIARYLAPNNDFLLVVFNFDLDDNQRISNIENVIEYKIGSFHKAKYIREVLRDLNTMLRRTHS